jgi:hypothetical protein
MNGAYRVQTTELRRLHGVLAAILEDTGLMGELSFIERENIQSTCDILQRLLPIIEVREIEDTLNES